MMIRLLTLLLCSSFLATLSHAQVVINEFSASNIDQFSDNYGKFEDWIELYNTSSQPFDLGGWGISDNDQKPQKYIFPEGTIIDGNDYLLVLCDGRGEVSGGYVHANFKLKQTKQSEEITLTNPAGEIVESYPLGLTQNTHSFARSEDGAGEWMISLSPTYGSANNSNAMIFKYAPTASLDQVAGIYTDGVTVSLLDPDPNYYYTYTTNGHLPSENDPAFPNALEISETQTVKVRAFPTNQDREIAGFIGFATYFINESFTLPVFSVAAETVQDLANGQGEVIPVGSLEYFSAEGELLATGYGSLNRHGQDSWVNNQRSLDWVTRDEMGYAADINAQLFNFSEKDNYQKFMFRASGDDNYPATNDPTDFDHEGSCHIRDEYVHQLVMDGGMDLDVRAVERNIVFLNGDYWGVYAHRNRPHDHDYTEYYYDQGKYDLQYLQTWGNSWAEYGGDEAFDAWDVTRDLALKNDMSDEAKYQELLDQLNVTSLIDYIVTNLMAVSSDWLNYNTGWWRGLNPEGGHKKWGYIMWDNDATFDYYINYSGVPNTDPDAVPCDIEDISDFMDSFFGTDTTFNVWGNQDTFWQYPDVGRHEKIFLKLIEENADFKQYYYQRSADHMNTIFSCDNMLGTLDSMLATIEPEMPRHIDRWGGSMAKWNSNVNRLRNFIEQRCELIDDGIVECYDLTGPFEVTVMTDPPGAGSIQFNTVKTTSLPWKGNYFGNMKNSIKAESNGDLAFSGWRATAGSSVFDNNLSAETDVLISEVDTLIAVFGELVNTDDFYISGDASVFPNPTTGEITVQLADFEGSTIDKVEVFSAEGKRVFVQHHASYQQGFSANLSSETSAGLYNIVITSGGQLFRGNFVITE